jgi:hypothetical protein
LNSQAYRALRLSPQSLSECTMTRDDKLMVNGPRDFCDLWLIYSGIMAFEHMQGVNETLRAEDHAPL